MNTLQVMSLFSYEMQADHSTSCQGKYCCSPCCQQHPQCLVMGCLGRIAQNKLHATSYKLHTPQAPCAAQSYTVQKKRDCLSLQLRHCADLDTACFSLHLPGRLLLFLLLLRLPQSRCLHFTPAWLTQNSLVCTLLRTAMELLFFCWFWKQREGSRLLLTFCLPTTLLKSMLLDTSPNSPLQLLQAVRQLAAL
ncbi:uncharacterized protein LOC134163303 isoform X1 [Pezoporus occidentalis]|uniref:uncharacterized protein LOC134163303 isoform X1 n=1 Tax=Pezoporus occidentalis TaxID=407982 RepID=UPI002F91A3D9